MAKNGSKKKRATPEIVSSDPMLRVANEVMKELSNSHEAVEALSAVQRAIDAEDAHWTRIFGNMEHDGPSLEELQQLDEDIREAIIKSPIVDRGAQLRHSYVWSKGVKLPEYASDPSKPGAKSRIEKVLTNPINRRYFLDGEAHEELERGLYTGGNVFALVDLKEHVARRIPLKEIADLITNPDFSEEVWAWKREWQHTNDKGDAETKQAWYYTSDCPLPKSKRAKTAIQGVQVDHTKVVVTHSVNRQIGWPLGVPDAVAAIVWAKLYSEFLKHGYVMSRALAAIAFRATVPTKNAGENVAIKMADTSGAGKTAVFGAANSLTALPTAGRGYDFDSGRPIAAMVATAVQVSIVHLLSDPGAAGSSYGSASNLDLPTKRAIVARQQSWAGFLNRLLDALGVPNANVSFPSLEEPDFFREVQSIIAGWSTGLLHEGEVRARLIALLAIETEETDAPDGVMLPNNEKSWARNDVDPKEAPGSDQGTGQGHSTGTGKGPNANDVRTDKLGSGSEALAIFQNLEIRELLEKVLAAVESREGGH